MKHPRFSMIVAVADNNVIGMKGEMPWPKMSADLRYFKEKTMGKWCILGRKSYNSLGNKVLPGRKFIVITRDKDFISSDSLVVNNIEEAMHHPAIQHEEEVMILGGGEIYRQSLPQTDRVYLTRIDAAFEGDTWFPELKKEEWILSAAMQFAADEKNPLPYAFLVYDRK